MRPTWVLLGVLVIAAAPLAGCFGAEEVVNERTVTASGGRVSPGWAYDGAGVEPAAASLTATFLNAENTGAATVAFDYAGSKWTVTFDTFAQAADKAFMDGGIAFDLAEHGDTGVADASIPRVLALVAAWGTATVTRDGVPVTGAAGERWAAHVMVSDTTVRNAEGKILKSDGATPYDPSAPGDATRVEGDTQVLLKLVHPDGETAARAPAPVAASLDFAGPEEMQTVEVPIETGAATLNVTFTAAPSQVGVGVGNFAARIVDAAGTEFGTASGSIQGPTGSVVLVGAPLGGAQGPLTIEVTGQGAFSLAIAGQVEYDDHPLLVLTWDDATVA